jgi:hypothetical protein
VTPTSTTRYTLTVKNSDGADATCDRLVTVSAPVTATVNAADCEIAAGKSGCATEVSWKFTRAPVSPNVWNIDRLLSVGVGVSGDKNHWLQYGVNRLEARSNLTVLDRVQPSAYCADDTDWVGGKCVAKASTITANPCVIAEGDTTCNSRMEWHIYTHSTPSIENQTTSMTYATVKNYRGDKQITYGKNIIRALHGTTEVVRTDVSATCTPGTSWVGGQCKKSAAVVPLTVSLSVDSAVVRMNEKTDIRWNVSTAIPAGYACSIVGPGLSKTPVTLRVGSIQSSAITSRSRYTLSCVSAATTVQSDVDIEVVPTVQEI